MTVLKPEKRPLLESKSLSSPSLLSSSSSSQQPPDGGGGGGWGWVVVAAAFYCIAVLDGVSEGFM